jgi:hypothetical protein
MTVTEQQSRDRVHVMEGPAPGRALAVLAWATSRGAIGGGAVLVAQVLRADLYAGATAVMGTAALLLPAAVLLLAYELRKRAWWMVAGQEDPAPPAPGWQLLGAAADAGLVIAVATVLTHSSGLGTAYPGAVGATALASFSAAHAVVMFARRGRGSTIMGAFTLVLRLGAAGAAGWVALSLMPDAWRLEQTAVGGLAGLAAFGLVLLATSFERQWSASVPHR